MTLRAAAMFVPLSEARACRVPRFIVRSSSARGACRPSPNRADRRFRRVTLDATKPIEANGAIAWEPSASNDMCPSRRAYGTVIIES